MFFFLVIKARENSRLLTLLSWLRGYAGGAPLACDPTLAPRTLSRSRKLYVCPQVPISEPRVIAAFVRDDVGAVEKSSNVKTGTKELQMSRHLHQPQSL